MLELTEKINQTIARIPLSVTDKQRQLFAEYIVLLQKWNHAYNLTAITQLDDILEKHLLDSLAIADKLVGTNFIDVGTGAGFPGIPLAILLPEKRFSLLDSNGKKTRFLQQVKLQLKLENVVVYHARVEQLAIEQKFDGVLSRAFASLADMLQGSERLCANQGHFYAMKGQFPETELQEITKPYKVLPIKWQNIQSERHLVIISQS